jgi:hypothetical protein
VDQAPAALFTAMHTRSSRSPNTLLCINAIRPIRFLATIARSEERATSCRSAGPLAKVRKSYARPRFASWLGAQHARPGQVVQLFLGRYRNRPAQLQYFSALVEIAIAHAGIPARRLISFSSSIRSSKSSDSIAPTASASRHAPGFQNESPLGRRTAVAR